MRPSRCNWPRCRCRRWGGKVRRDIISVRTAPNIRNPKVAGLLVNQSRRGEEIRGAEIPDMGRITCIARCFSQPYLLTTCHPEGLQSQGAHSSAPFASVLSTFSPPRRYDAIPDFHISPPPSQSSASRISSLICAPPNLASLCFFSSARLRFVDLLSLGLFSNHIRYYSISFFIKIDPRKPRQIWLRT